MEKVQLSKNGPSLSRIVAGVMNWGAWGAQLSDRDMGFLIDQCADNGITSFDHADIYGGHTTEANFGRALARAGSKRSDIQIVTKCGIMMPSDHRPEIKAKHYNTSKDHLLRSVETSLQNLNTDYIDVLLIHRPSPLMHPDIIGEAFELLKECGKVRFFGVSNFTTSQFNMLQSRLDLCTTQVEASLMYLDPFLDGTFDHAIQENYRPMIWSPLGRGLIFKSQANAEILLRRERLRALSDDLGWTLDMLSYVFLLHHPAQMLPITGSSNIDRILVAQKALNVRIDDETWFRIWTAATGKKVP